MRQPGLRAAIAAFIAAFIVAVWGCTLVTLASPSPALAAASPSPAAKAAKPADSESASEPTTDIEKEITRLPSDWRNADGTINEASIVAQQKKRLDLINKEMKLQLRMTETLHFLVFSNAAADTTQLFMTWGEALYLSLCRQFEIKPTDRLWDGKCVLLLFATDVQYHDYAKKFDGDSMDKAGAYFMWERRVLPGVDSSKFPQLVHICIPIEKRKPAALQATFTHEATHAFFELFHKPVKLPLWLNEGLAEYMAVVNDPSLRAYKIGVAKRFSMEGKSLRPLLDNKTDSLDVDLYPVAYSVVETLQALGGAKFKQFVMALKDGKSEDEASKTAYGVDLSGIEKIWRDYMSRLPASIRTPPSSRT